MIEAGNDTEVRFLRRIEPFEGTRDRKHIEQTSGRIMNDARTCARVRTGLAFVHALRELETTREATLFQAGKDAPAIALQTIGHCPVRAGADLSSTACGKATTYIALIKPWRDRERSKNRADRRWCRRRRRSSRG